ncbi:MAG: RdgB/HAM1 family non-canonical purine NTP pyrophosphatase [Gammaproteobacteria bacterium]|nr:RdgB/HAM1 family non-canonical purine NTP pyrophosphatase [Gammaproteobacteria bacterium]NIV75698.1 RdgB/HAM1 family non-canonical purine NTP pyrophosphatase [Gammaproteobacteria bacterium]
MNADLDTDAARVVIATRNEGKLREISEMLEDVDLDVLSLAGFDLTEAEETGLTFVENAIIKARHAARGTGLAAIADDSGLEVDLLHGAPGVQSARYAGTGAADAENIARLLQELDGAPSEARTARFRCVMVYLRHAEDPAPIIAQGTWQGRILSRPRGENGFGYDPVFFVPSRRCSAAELDAKTKNRLSHRGQALRSLVAMLGAEGVAEG